MPKGGEYPTLVVMYRDGANALDEHDRAVGAILIGEGLVAQCERLAQRTRDPNMHQRWHAIREVQDDYPEIWRQLDRARQILASRGANTMAYEELRPHVLPSPTVTRDGQSQDINAAVLEDARRAIAELKLAVPGADWKAIEKRTHDLVETPQLHRRHRGVVAGLVSLFVLAVLGWAIAIQPEPKKDPRAEMRKELSQIAEQRKVKITYLQLALLNRCDAELARDYVKLLVLDGRGDAAELFADDYFPRCGSDTVVENWANAPRAPR